MLHFKDKGEFIENKRKRKSGGGTKTRQVKESSSSTCKEMLHILIRFKLLHGQDLKI